MTDAAEAEIVKQCQRSLQIDVAHPASVPVDGDRHLGVEADQVAAQQGLIVKLLQVLLAFCPGHVAGMVEDRFQGAILFEQLPGELWPDQRHARHVIHRIAHQGLKIDHLWRRDSPFSAERFAVKNLVLADVEDFHAIGDQLPTIFVASHQKALAAKFRGLPGDGRQHVVGFVRRAAEGRDAQRGDNAADGRNLWHQILVHLHPPDLVLGVHRVAKGFAGQVERAEQIIRPLLFEQVQQISREAEHGPYRLALRTGHLGQGMKDLVDQRVRIHYPDALVGQTFRFSGGRRGTRDESPAALCFSFGGSGGDDRSARPSASKPGNDVCRVLRAFMGITFCAKSRLWATTVGAGSCPPPDIATYGAERSGRLV